MSFPRYPEYKDSGVEWLGEVPAHWEAVPIKRLAKLKGGAGFPHEEQGKLDEELNFYKVAALSNAGPNGALMPSEDTVSRETADRLGAQIFPPKSIVFAKVGAALLLGRIRTLATEGCIDNNMMGAIAKDLNDVAFLVYVLSLVKFDLIANPGAVPSLNVEQVGSYLLPRPPEGEQRAIAAFLDRETARIDALIAEQEKLIALLKEKRQALISHAVTKGLDPNAPMKDSGIEWLGQVPAHWDVIPTKRLFKLIVDPAPDDNDFELLSIYTDIGVRPRKELEAKGNKATTTDGYFRVAKGDLIVNKLLAWMGAIGVSRYDGVTSPAYDILRAATPLEPEFYDHLFRCGILFSEFRRFSRGIMDMRLRLYFEQLGQMKMPCPPKDEQRQIVDWIDDRGGVLDDLVCEAAQAILLLKERRAALISAAVTGKICVLDS